MNRKARRAGRKSSDLSVDTAIAGHAGGAFAIADLLAQANLHHQQGQPEKAQLICNEILAREPSHVDALNLSGLALQAAGRHRLAVKVLAKAIAADPLNAACHYNIAASYQALQRQDEAAMHFAKAIALGRRQIKTEKLVLQNPVITACIERIEERWPLPVKIDELFSRPTLAAIAGDIFLRCALQTVLLSGLPLERFLTLLRSALTGLAYSSVLESKSIDPDLVLLLIAVAQQNFINEYVFVQSQDETRRSNQLRDLLRQKLGTSDAISPVLLAAVAAYFPLHGLPEAPALLIRTWPEMTAALVQQQLREPLQEIEDRTLIPALTPVDDAVSLRVMQQYEENPYPRWMINPLGVLAGGRDLRAGDGDSNFRAEKEILIAGCGSGQHAFEVAQYFPKCRVLAVDISLPSLAYARRKTREAGLRNIEYAQADILKLPTLDRTFDRIEAVGVLHHLADPELGLNVLEALLRPGGEMRIGLYSETGRRAVTAVRAMIAERGYGPTAEDIRRCRQDILRDHIERDWLPVVEAGDFYCMSGCRDLLFHVMEHRFTLPQIKSLLAARRLSFLGFDLDPRLIEQFQKQFPGAAALTELDKWHVFETDNPQTFRNMYVFTVRKNELNATS